MRAGRGLDSSERGSRITNVTGMPAQHGIVCNCQAKDIERITRRRGVRPGWAGSCVPGSSIRNVVDFERDGRQKTLCARLVFTVTVTLEVWLCSNRGGALSRQTTGRLDGARTNQCQSRGFDTYAAQTWMRGKKNSCGNDSL